MANVPFEVNGKQYTYNKSWRRVQKTGNTNIGQKLQETSKGIYFVEAGKRVYLPEYISKIFKSQK